MATMSGFLPTLERLAAREYVAVDFETANKQGGLSACQVALTRVVEGEIAQELSTYVRPPEGYQRFEFTWLHGIEWEDVQDAPEWWEIAEDIADFVGDAPVWAHHARFDHGVWFELDQHFAQRSLPEEFYCTVLVSRRTAPHLPNHKLPTVTEHYCPGFNLHHHQAQSDARACAMIVAGLQRDPASTQVLSLG